VDVNANPQSPFCDCDLQWYVLILSTAEHGHSTDVLVLGTAKIKLTSFDASGSVSFSPLVMTHSYTELQRITHVTICSSFGNLIKVRTYIYIYIEPFEYLRRFLEFIKYFMSF
jgi:hypothetical protein